MLIGIVTIDDVLDVAEATATREIQRIGGSEALDEPYMDTSFWQMVQKRAGWLTVLFVGEMLTATAMGVFEAEIAQAVTLALFVPLIISSGGNSGSQASVLVIRALALRRGPAPRLVARDARARWARLALGAFSAASASCASRSGRLFDRSTASTGCSCHHRGGVAGRRRALGHAERVAAAIPAPADRVRSAVSSAPFVATLVDVTGW
jgi:magnesium transporter